LASAAGCGLKKSGKVDMGLIYCPEGATAAAVFTTNKITSAAVQVSKRHIKSATIFAVVVNSGNANACTGRMGIANAIKMCSETAGKLNIADAHQVLVASTGIIGEQLPMKKVKVGISNASKKLSDSASSGLAFAEAIMTTDTRCKQTVRKVTISGKQVTIAGAVKGAGMIAPKMATTLLFITSDVVITKALLKRALKDSVGRSLNRLTVDGHQSTNDTAIILASGAAENRAIKSKCPRYKRFSKALSDLCEDLVKQMALDAEGATRMFKVVIKGAASRADAMKASRAVADYTLVKCAVHGGDANWGRIICAVGSCGVKLNPAKVWCKLDNLIVFRNGSPARFDVAQAGRIVSGKEHTITVNLGSGTYSDYCYGCDLSQEYVAINAEYHT